MLEIMSVDIENAVAIKISGKITQEDVIKVMDYAKDKIAKYGNIVILKEFESFDGIEFSAIIEEFKYLYEFGVSNITRGAILTDKKWLETAVNIEDKLFKNIEMECFALDEKEKALEFLRA